MKVPFVAGGSPATVFALAPLATAVRNAGHQAFMAATDDMMPLLATRLGVPFVRQAWDAVEATGVHPGADEELQPELRDLDLDRLPEPDLFVDLCPPSLRPADASPAQQMRFVPTDAQRSLRCPARSRPCRSPPTLSAPLEKLVQSPA